MSNNSLSPERKALSTLYMFSQRAPENTMAARALYSQLDKYLAEHQSQASQLSELQARVNELEARELELMAELETATEKKAPARRRRKVATDG